MSLVYMPFPVSWFHSLSALLSVLLKRMPSKGNFWQKSWARILCSSALHYVGTSSRENPARSPSQAWLWLVPMSPQSEVSHGPRCPHGPRWQDPPGQWLGEPWHALTLTALSSNLLYIPATSVCHLQGFQRKEKKAKLKKRKKNAELF